MEIVKLIYRVFLPFWELSEGENTNSILGSLGGGERRDGGEVRMEK